jgi:hypothetical protein
MHRLTDRVIESVDFTRAIEFIALLEEVESDYDEIVDHAKLRLPLKRSYLLNDITSFMKNTGRSTEELNEEGRIDSREFVVCVKLFVCIILSKRCM